METKLIQSILFLKGRVGTDVKEIASILKMKQKDVLKFIEELEKELKKTKSPLVVKKLNDKYRLTVSKEVSEVLSEKMDKTINVKLSKSALETLTIIAYNQPATKPQVEKIRGVSADYAISKLLEFELIEEAGLSDLPGKPRLFQTTPLFLETFGIDSLEDLPEMPEDIMVKKEEESLFDYD